MHSRFQAFRSGLYQGLLFCRGLAAFAGVPPVGLPDPETISRLNAKSWCNALTGSHLHNWLVWHERGFRFQGLPPHMPVFGLGGTRQMGLAINEMVRTGKTVSTNRGSEV